ncbi:PAS-domain containing protein [Pseudooceanicola sp. LIPI14-2-Ac024]|uniref:PAS-domain containing protein n=1 Tax=Pseudooceanicola sp. LIPI14-2-Ac024 TaxID=3344875 RepID=UPI0035CEDFF4
MPDLDLSAILTIVAISCSAALLALLSTAAFARIRWQAAATEGDHCDHETPIEFLFHNGELRDLTPPAAEVLAPVEYRVSDWQRVGEALLPRFPGFPSDPPARGVHRYDARGAQDGAWVEVVTGADALRVIVHEATPGDTADRHLRRLAEIQMRRTDSAVARAPFPIWATDAKDAVRWSNLAYQRISRAHPDDHQSVLATGLPLPRGETPVTARVQVGAEAEGQPGTWYDVSVMRHGDRWLHYGVDVSAVIRAEIAQRNFVQTLTKTFALLSIGLAIFNRERRLTLFNPAMIDLTGLEPEFLSGRPSLPSFFDALRERRVMPEPKNYRGWREAISDLDARAADGSFEETWSLPSGATFRVTGRPYPDGAIAFVLEDISDKIGMSRRFQQLTKRTQSVIDTFDEAVAIFSPGARLTLYNTAYARLWGLPEEMPAEDEITVLQATRHWQERAQPTPIWGELRDFASDFGARAEWDGEVRLTDGRRVYCRFVPLPDGATMAGFREVRETVRA